MSYGDSCWMSTTILLALIGRGSPWTALWSRLLLEEKTPAQTRRIGEKKGTKRSLLGDANGIPLALAVGGANVNDMVLVPETLDNIVAFRPIPTPEREQNLAMDKGYDFAQTDRQVRQHGFMPHIRHRGEGKLEYQDPNKPARRWVIERSNSWMNRFRRVLIRWEKKTENYVAMIEFAFSTIIFNKLKKENGLFG